MMRKILFLTALCFIVCVGCKNEEPPQPPPLDNTYLDLENLWTVYAKNIDTVKNLFKGNFISEKDSIRDRLGVKIMYKVLTYKNNTPAGNFTIQCIFYKDILIEIHANSYWINTPMQAFPHYKAMSNEADLFAKSTFFEFGCRHWAYVSHYNPLLPNVTFNYGNTRDDYFAYINDYIPKFSTNIHDKPFSCEEKWEARAYDISGYPGDSNDPPPTDTSKSMILLFNIAQDGRTQIIFLMTSTLSQVIDF